jgi:predicted NAD-dependent protein-ADP-ribosyltransferase YbiA (DUF1768 family)
MALGLQPDGGSDVSDLTEFLLARIAEDEAAVGRHLADASRTGWGDYPVRVLRECEAKREIIRAFRLNDEHGSTGLGTAIRLLAAVYAGHADYRDEWRA